MSVFLKLQSALISSYSLVRSTGLFNTRAGSEMFLALYFAYKKWLEDPHAQLISRYPELFKGGNLVDIGANCGYITTLFAGVVAKGFKVYSFEPEIDNFRLLKLSVGKLSNPEQIVPFQFAVGAASENGTLFVNKRHVGDHRLVNSLDTSASTDTSPIRIEPLDKILDEENALQNISFVKIDVQGSEHLVLSGMERVIRENPGIGLSLEISAEDDLSVQKLLSVCSEDFKFFEIKKNGTLLPLTRHSISADKESYRDILATRKVLSGF